MWVADEVGVIGLDKTPRHTRTIPCTWCWLLRVLVDYGHWGLRGLRGSIQRSSDIHIESLHRPWVKSVICNCHL